MSKVKCLLVDDLEDNLLVLDALLRSDDVELLAARSGVAALDLLLEHDVALALVDVQMPEMDGFELAELMRGSARTRHVPLIFVTAGTRDQHRMFKGYDSGAVDFLYKPIEPIILKNKAEVFFKLYRQKQQLEQELRDRTELLRLHEMFAAALGHDLRTPLAAIVNSAQLLPRLTEDPAVREVASRVLSSGHRMTHLIEDLLDITRIRLGGGIPISRRPINLAGTVDRVVKEQQSSSGTVVAISLDGDDRGQWDEERIAQVFANVIANAHRHGAVNTPVTVRIDGRATDAVSVAVTNHGRPAPGVIATMFDPFRRGRMDAGRHEGLGLGLYIAKQIVDAHAGTISMAVADPGLTVFTIALPRMQTAFAPLAR